MKYKIICLQESDISVKYAKECIEQAKKFNITLEIFNGIHGNDSENHIIDLNIKRKWNFKAGRKGVDGCFLSHFYLWKNCVEDNVPYLILEHDGYFIKPLPDNILDNFIDVIKLDNYNPFKDTYNDSIKKDMNNPITYIQYHNSITKNKGLNETGNYFKGAYSYIIKPHAAKKVIDFVYEKGFLPADVLLGDAILDLKVVTPTIVRLHPDYFKRVKELSLTRNLHKLFKKGK